MNRTVEEEKVVRQQEITQIIMLQHILRRVNALEAALLPISEAIESLCGSTAAIANGFVQLAKDEKGGAS
jgi:hypothetical protein